MAWMAYGSSPVGMPKDVKHRDGGVYNGEWEQGQKDGFGVYRYLRPDTVVLFSICTLGYDGNYFKTRLCHPPRSGSVILVSSECLLDIQVPAAQQVSANDLARLELPYFTR